MCAVYHRCARARFIMDPKQIMRSSAAAASLRMNIYAQIEDAMCPPVPEDRIFTIEACAAAAGTAGGMDLSYTSASSMLMMFYPNITAETLSTTIIPLANQALVSAIAKTKADAASSENGDSLSVVKITYELYLDKKDNTPPQQHSMLLKRTTNTIPPPSPTQQSSSISGGGGHFSLLLGRC